MLVFACSGPLTGERGDDAVTAPGLVLPDTIPAVPDVRAALARGAEAARVATRYVGVPYVWGGSSPSGFDCSGLVRYAFGKVGIALPRRVVEQFEHGSPVSRAELKPGDLVFFDRLRHNGIYVGHGRFVHSTQRGDVVKVSRLDDDWYRTRWVGARRL